MQKRIAETYHYLSNVALFLNLMQLLGFGTCQKVTFDLASINSNIEYLTLGEAKMAATTINVA